MSDEPLYRIWDAKGRPLDPSPIATLTAERDAAIAERDALRAEIAKAMDLLEDGRLYREDGTEVPTTLSERVQWQGAGLGEATAENYRLRDERDAARAEVAMLSAAREADRRMLGRILGGESEASTVVLLEQVEMVLSGLRAEVAAMTDRDGDRWAEVRRIVDADSGHLDRVFNAVTGRRDG